MTMSDPIADMLARIRNAGRAKFSSADIPGSNLKIEIARILKEQGYIKNYKNVKLLVRKDFNLMEMVRITGMGKSTILQYRDLVYLYHPDMKEKKKT